MKAKIVWQDEELRLELHESEIPWLILHPKEEYREFSEVARELRLRIMDLLCAIEEEMLVYYRPHKINIASFGNYLPRQHWHIMARFQEDSYFPEPMWGSRQREGTLELPPTEPFLQRVKERLQKSSG
jgi:diadenosine tetraphosphate (Ap4A) HIT family hydrolase